MTYLKESRIASRLNESFATLSGVDRKSSANVQNDATQASERTRNLVLAMEMTANNITERHKMTSSRAECPSDRQICSEH